MALLAGNWKSLTSPHPFLRTHCLWKFQAHIAALESALDAAKAEARAAGVAAAILVLSVAVAQPERKAPERARVAKSPKWVSFTAVYPLQARGHAEGATRASRNRSEPFQQIPCRDPERPKFSALAYPLLCSTRTGAQTPEKGRKPGKEAVFRRNSDMGIIK